MTQQRKEGGRGGRVGIGMGVCTVRLTSTGIAVPGKREFRLAPIETIVGQVKKNKKSHSGHRLRLRTLEDTLGRSFVHFT